VRSKGEDIAHSRDGHGPRIRNKGSRFDRLHLLANNDLIHLIEREAGNFDRSVDEDEFFELDLERIEIPFAFLRQAIDGKAKNSLLFRR